jgi:hypothetical protein
LVGEWLLDKRLLNTRLDIRIRGTKETLLYNGRYDNACGWMVLTKPLSDVDDHIAVKLGYTQSNLYFPARHIFPETTTERPGFVHASAALPVVSVQGERVVIIGTDGLGQSDCVGKHALIIHCP